MRNTCIFSFSGYNLISCRNEPTVTGQVAEPRPELRRAALRRRAAPWREASQASQTSASSVCTEDEGQGVGPCWPASPSGAAPCHSAQHSAPSYYWALWSLQEASPVETPTRFQTVCPPRYWGTPTGHRDASPVLVLVTPFTVPSTSVSSSA